MAIAEDTNDLTKLAEVDPDAILDRLNDSIARKMPTYRELYLRWERLNWQVGELDFTEDRAHWLALPETYRERLLWTLASFYVAEQRVAATLTPFVTAAPKQEQKVFLATQCVDEARHAIFFDRWFQEVVAPGDQDLAKRLRSSRQWVGPGFAPLFDDYLEEVTGALRRDPGDLRLFAKAMAMYHIVIEGVLALTGQKFILAWARNNAILPGFRAGFTAVARDESRHVSFGARVIRDLLHEDPSLIAPVHEGIRETLLLGTRLYQPPGGDIRYTSVFGYSLTDLIRYGGIQLEKKMRAIGAPMPEIDVHCPEMDGAWPPVGGGLLPRDLRQRVTMGFVRTVGRALPTVAPGLSMMMLHLAFAPERTTDLEAVYRFDLSGPGGGVFTVTLRHGTCDISVGDELAPADVVYEMEASTWLAMSQGRVTGDEALLLGRLRVRGNSQLARRFGDFFAPPGAPALQQDGDLPLDPGSGPARLLQRALRRRPAA